VQSYSWPYFDRMNSYDHTDVTHTVHKTVRRRLIEVGGGCTLACFLLLVGGLSGYAIRGSEEKKASKEIIWEGPAPNGTVAAQICRNMTVRCDMNRMCSCGDVKLDEEALIFAANPSLEHAGRRLNYASSAVILYGVDEDTTRMIVIPTQKGDGATVFETTETEICKSYGQEGIVAWSGYDTLDILWNRRPGRTPRSMHVRSDGKGFTIRISSDCLEHYTKHQGWTVIEDRYHIDFVNDGAYHNNPWLELKLGDCGHLSWSDYNSIC